MDGRQPLPHPLQWNAFQVSPLAATNNVGRLYSTELSGLFLAYGPGENRPLNSVLYRTGIFIWYIAVIHPIREQALSQFSDETYRLTPIDKLLNPIYFRIALSYIISMSITSVDLFLLSIFACVILN
jgi:hypothetical protein